MSSNQNILGQGSIPSLLLKLSVPAIAAQIINALYSIIDRMFIGHIEGVGAAALTGVGITFPIIILISAFSSLVGMGGAPRAAIKMGKGKNKDAEKILGTSFASLILISLILTITFLLFNEKLLYLFGASSATIKYSLEYLNIYVIGTIFVQLSLGLNPYINTQGFSKISMCTVIIGAVTNIILDPIFIFVLDLGVRGAALATIIAQAISCIWVVRFLTGDKTIIKLKKKYIRIKKKIILPILALGISPFIMQSTESLVSITFNTTLQRYGGDLAVGSMTIITSLLQIMMMPLLGLTQGAQPIMSYNYGAGNITRVKDTFKLLIKLNLLVASALWLIVMLVPQVFVSLFTKDAALIQATSGYLKIFMATFFVLGAQMACQQAFLALSKAKISLFLALLRKVILLVPLAIILPLKFNAVGVFLSEPVADFIATSVTVITFTIFYKRKLTKKELKYENKKAAL
ncbi:MATE family efflux transporter [Clostridium sp.]|uniref:MATE family efflux transporter n=2 Tax=Clostridium sp. TaxID=1506 RepID=UPI002FCA2A20